MAEARAAWALEGDEALPSFGDGDGGFPEFPGGDFPGLGDLPELPETNPLAVAENSDDEPLPTFGELPAEEPLPSFDDLIGGSEPPPSADGDGDGALVDEMREDR